jgi:ubiquinone/menaquinone biosynthesis C-methylase UbiE
MTASNQPELPDGEPLSFHQIQTSTGWKRTLSHFARWCTPQAGWQVLDAGSGPGYLAARLAEAGCQALAVDRNWRAFLPGKLHHAAATADVLRLPFQPALFDLIAASNLLFLLAEPQAALSELRRCLNSNGQLALLNPSEKMSVANATDLAAARGLQGADRASLLNYASRAQDGHRWSAAQLARLLDSTGFRLVETSLHMGPGLICFARARLA